MNLLREARERLESAVLLLELGSASDEERLEIIRKSKLTLERLAVADIYESESVADDDDYSTDPLYGMRMDSADCGESDGAESDIERERRG